MKKIIIVLVLSLLLSAGCAQVDSSQPPSPSPTETLPSPSNVPDGPDTGSKGLLWEVSDGDTTVYLLGSIHVDDETIYPFSKQLMDVITTSDALILEVDIGDEEGLAYVQNNILYGDDDKLSNHISAELMAQVIEAFTPYGLDSAMLEMFKPWVLASELESIAFYGEIPNPDTMVVIDQFVYNTATEHAIPVRQIESYQYQTDLFNTLDDAALEDYLQSCVDMLEDPEAQEARELLHDMLKAWCERDLEAFNALYEKDAYEDPVSLALFSERDINMHAYVSGLLRDEPGQYLVTVGAGHMVGDTGIVARLTEEGYAVSLVPAA